MTTVASSTSTNTSSTNGQSSSLTALGANYELFLSILTTQIKNQDPLDPMDSSEYTQQLVQYSSVEQQIKTNDQLATMLAAIDASSVSGYVNYLGTEITATGATTHMEGGEANWIYTAESGGRAQVEIRDAYGALVYQKDHTLENGQNTFSWDGKNNSGSQLGDGFYTITITQYDADGNLGETVPTMVSGVVDGIDFTDGVPVLLVGDSKIPVSQVYSVRSRSS